MNLKRKPSLVQFLAGASVAAMGASAPLAMAQDATAGDETSDEILQDDVKCWLNEHSPCKVIDCDKYLEYHIPTTISRPQKVV